MHPTPSPERRARAARAHRLRVVRKIHRTAGVTLFALLMVLGSTGLLLGWKKHSGGYILPTSHRGTSTDPADWLPLDTLHAEAMRIAREEISPTLSPELERIDVRPKHGMVKFVFIEDYWGIQLDLATGDLLHIERRRSDFIENLHDGSILDYLLDTDGEWLKLGYTSIMGTGILVFSVTGIWLWLGPRRMRRR